MICDLCRQQTDKNFFPDPFTILCESCAASGRFMCGQPAKDFIQQKTNATKEDKNGRVIKKTMGTIK